MKPESSIRRGMAVEVKIVSEADGLVDYVASNEAVDSYNEVVAVSGWDFSRFAKNAPFVDSHNYWSIDKLLGSVVSARVEGRNLIERVQWAKDVKESAMAQLGWKMTLGGFLKAVSVGFIPVKYVRNGGEGWSQALSEIGRTVNEGAEISYIYLKQIQIELSACIIGANPEALAKSYSSGCIRDADLAAVGFSDSDMHFLTVAGKAMERPDTDDVTRTLIAREMSRIQISQKANKQSPSQSPGKPGGGEMAERQAEQRKAFLESLSKI
jgi:hypothetical protein